MPSDEETQYGQDLESEDEENEIDEDDEDEDSDSQSTSSNGPNTIVAAQTPPPTITAPTTTITTVIVPNAVTPQPQQLTEEKKPSPFDDSRKLFQRLWTDEDEISLLRGYLDYITPRGGGSGGGSHHIDTAPFYDQIKNRLQLDFNKNQLVDKLRRLKKKYRNAVDRITSGKDFTFKTPHDQTTFEIAHNIWGAVGASNGRGGIEEAKVDEDNNTINEPKPKHPITEIKSETNNGFSVTNPEKMVARLGKRPRQTVEEDNIPNESDKQVNSTIPNIIEDTIRSCISPLLKELFGCATNGFCMGGPASNPWPLNFNLGGNSTVNGEVMDEKWKKQQILELEVYSKRIELVQEQIKSALEELKSDG